MKEKFKNKTQMKNHIKHILNNWCDDPDDLALILWLASEYRQCSVNKITVQKDDYGNNQFATEFGSFSYLKAVDYVYGKVETDKQKFTSAVRRHLMPYMREFRDATLKVNKVCPITQKHLNTKNVHVDHVGDYEFSDIIDSFLHENDVSGVEYVSTDSGDLLKDISLFEKFKEHHDKLAVLQLVHADWNLTRGKIKMNTENKSHTPVEIRDSWSTPQVIFDNLHKEFNFTLDVAASDLNHKCDKYFTENDDALSQNWEGVIWCNPPYSEIPKWTQKAAVEAFTNDAKIVMLVPSDTSVKWFKDAWSECSEIRFISGRISFINAATGKAVAGNNKGSVLLIWDGFDGGCGKPSVSLVNRDDLLLRSK